MQEENWKAFRKNNTEAGRLLARLYGVEGVCDARAKISYPKPKQQKRTFLAHRQVWRDVGSSARDPKEQKHNRAGAAAVSVPKFRQKQIKQKAAIDCIPRRKPASICMSEREKQEAYRPPTKPAVSAEEKEKLCEINTFRGGKGLPRDLTHPEGELPSSILRREEEEKRKLLTNAKGDKDANSMSTSKASTDLLFDQVVKEIKERQQFQLEMELAGVDSKSRQSMETINIEILSRIKELYRLDKEKARHFLKGQNRALSTL